MTLPTDLESKCWDVGKEDGRLEVLLRVKETLKRLREINDNVNPHPLVYQGIRMEDVESEFGWVKKEAKAE